MSEEERQRQEHYARQGKTNKCPPNEQATLKQIMKDVKAIKQDVKAIKQMVKRLVK